MIDRVNDAQIVFKRTLRDQSNGKELTNDTELIRHVWTTGRRSGERKLPGNVSLAELVVVFCIVLQTAQFIAITSHDSVDHKQWLTFFVLPNKVRDTNPNEESIEKLLDSLLYNSGPAGRQSLFHQSIGISSLFIDMRKAQIIRKSFMCEVQLL